MQYYPIKKSKRPYNTFGKVENLEKNEIGGFAGYKVGMIQLSYIDSDKNSPTFKMEVITNATVLESPPLFVCALRFYNKGSSIGESWGSGINKFVARQVKFKENNKSVDDFKGKFDDIRLIVSTQPWKIDLKKKPEVFELCIGGNLEDKLTLGKELLSKEIEASSVIKDGNFVDVASVTKGKGFTGSVKRYGVKIYPVHASKSRRKAGNLGAESMAKVQFTVPQHGRLGFNSRVEYNKFVFRVIKDADEVNIPSGYKRYGNVKGSAIILKGSVPGSASRLIMLRKAIRPTKKAEPVKVTVLK
ncbi:MAG: ribosomal protein L3 [Candidatus Parvarchaeum acidiphilum ARMAN-4]|jgi:large subunit ribosomal protein L3|uniref:Ribosomal protein L3 n=1 Tax=Candidatus Parvarchaeum acidiphilum ARMAN-4 TaxID=662760 RepID=D2EG74_PARA4|nr:MAG: ribosomal protein L3 [Candidatus Parvarchaeum acidiphilum ARMAN-4]